jgi:hypothetical protein
VTEPNDELRALLAAEKANVQSMDAVRVRLSERLAPLLDASPGAALPAPRPRPRLGWLKFAAGLGGAFAAGVGVGYAVRGAAPAPAPRVEVRYIETPAPSAPPPMPPIPPVETVPTPVRSAPFLGASAPTMDRPAPSTRTSIESPDQDLARERQLVDQARSALARGDADGALAAVGEHVKAFPRGELTEMREALAVQALVGAGRFGEARARGKVFSQRYPASAYRPAIDAALKSIP